MPENNEAAFSLKREVVEWVETLVWAVVTVVLVFTFIARTATVDGSSMLPTLEHGDQLIISHLGYTPQYGDIVVIAPPGYADRPLIKRVIATEGQEVDIDFENGIVYVDGNMLDEPYINEPTYRNEGTDFPQVVPEGSIFVLGDNRNDSKDSRHPTVGMVDKRYVLGKQIVRYMPFDKFGVAK